MMFFLGLLAAVLGLITLITLSVIELLVIPWPILLVLLFLTLWISQRLINRFNPAPEEGEGDGAPLEDRAQDTLESGKLLAKPAPSSHEHPVPNTLCYRGRMYADLEEKALEIQEPTVGEKSVEVNQCYRGIRVSDRCPEASSDTPSAAHPPASPAHKEKDLKPVLRYRGIKTL